jgi:hypothetical protein
MAAGDDADFLAAERGDSDYEEEQRAAAAAAKCRKRAGDMGYSELQKECRIPLLLRAASRRKSRRYVVESGRPHPLWGLLGCRESGRPHNYSS